MSRREIEVRKCDRCGASENFDDTSRASERRKQWHEFMQIAPVERVHDLCPPCGELIDQILRNVEGILR